MTHLATIEIRCVPAGTVILMQDEHLGQEVQPREPVMKDGRLIFCTFADFAITQEILFQALGLNKEK